MKTTVWDTLLTVTVHMNNLYCESSGTRVLNIGIMVVRVHIALTDLQIAYTHCRMPTVVAQSAEFKCGGAFLEAAVITKRCAVCSFSCLSRSPADAGEL